MNYDITANKLESNKICEIEFIKYELISPKVMKTYLMVQIMRAQLLFSPDPNYSLTAGCRGRVDWCCCR